MNGERDGRNRGVGLVWMSVMVLGWAMADETADHRAYEVLQQPFADATEVTQACLTCHQKAADQVMKTIHWYWMCPKSVEKGEPLGKAHVINNFCIAVPSNEPRCTSCHAGYGWKDKHFDFANPNHVDCLVCHDQTGTYEKFPTDAGHPVYEPKVFDGRTWEPPDLNQVAQNVGKPTRATCGACHFYGGGGEGVKHADLDTSLFEPDRDLDVHMAAKGLNFNCQDCHTTRKHEVSGRCYGMPAADQVGFTFPASNDEENIRCESCHTDRPHASSKLNDHLDRVSCQACHIPRAARVKPTKASWDWSEAGQLDEQGKPVVKQDEQGRVIYHGMKGAFEWKQDFVPEYVWFNGRADHISLHDEVDPDGVVQINPLGGSSEDPNARIWPVKVHRGKQPMDPIRRRLVTPQLFGSQESDAYWKHFDWKRAITAGMAYVGEPFSGEVAFVKSEMYWPITHMVAPADQAVKCGECHGPEGRLKDIHGVYIPGQTRYAILDRLGILLVLLTAAAVVVHLGGRLVSGSRRRSTRG